MRILILDDDEKRQEAFEKRFRGNDLVHAFTSAQAIVALANGVKFDLVFLDHDLGEKVCEPYPHEITGDDVAHWMVASLTLDQVPDQIVIHSWNPDGAKRMFERLHDAGFNAVINKFRDSEAR